MTALDLARRLQQGVNVRLWADRRDGKTASLPRLEADTTKLLDGSVEEWRTVAVYLAAQVWATQQTGEYEAGADIRALVIRIEKVVRDHDERVNARAATQTDPEEHRP